MCLHTGLDGIPNPALAGFFMPIGAEVERLGKHRTVLSRQMRGRRQCKQYGKAAQQRLEGF